VTGAIVEMNRVCPECEDEMTLVHRGQFSTLYVCRICGCTLTLPPPVPAVPPKPHD
jgi:hypothetical protein